MTTVQTDAPAIRMRGIEKTFGDLRVLRGVDLDVAPGSIFALLGSNGAGKTTLVRVLSTLLKADAGTATVHGSDVATAPGDVREAISLTGQFAAVDEVLTGRENLVLVARLRHLANPAQVADDLLARFSLVDAGSRRAGTYSGGMRRRLDIAMSLVGDPAVVFLDEPTTGLDPRARLGLWEVIDTLVARGTTLLLTTQYMDEAERLADDIAVIDRGKVIARGDADELKSQVGGERIEIGVPDAGDQQVACRELASVASGEIQLDSGTGTLTVPLSGAGGGAGAEALVAALGKLAVAGVRVTDVALRKPTLDDVFLTLTGHEAEKTEEAAQ